MDNLIKEKNCWDKNSVLWPFMENHVPELFKFVTPILKTCTINHTTHTYYNINETIEHKLHRIKQVKIETK